MWGRLASRFAGFLEGAGVKKGDRVAGFLPRVPETIAIMLGAWKAGAVYVPIFTGFGPDADRSWGHAGDSIRLDSAAAAADRDQHQDAMTDQPGLCARVNG